jgi:hypothetical protein
MRDVVVCIYTTMMRYIAVGPVSDLVTVLAE